MGDALSYIRKERLGHFEGMLIASGWTTNKRGGWLAPKTAYLDPAGRNFRETIAVTMGRGHLELAVAVACQIRADQAALTPNKGHSND